MKEKVFNIFKEIKYYILIWSVVLDRSINLTFAYRVEFFAKFVKVLFVLFTQILIVYTLFNSTDSVRGWNRDSYYLLLGIYNVVNYLGWSLFNVNLWRIEERILKGEFDFALLSPAGPLFSTAFNQFFFDDLICAISGFFLISYYLLSSNEGLTPTTFILLTFTICCALIIWFAIHLLVASTTLYSVKNGVFDFTKSVTRVGSFPIEIFPPALQLFFYTLFPIAFISVIPSKIILDQYSLIFLPISFFVAITSLYISYSIWNRSLKRYSSNGG